jgi:two-component system cell cycle sensor histidine kinase PleC
MHDGALEMTSTPGEGTTVSFILPINQGGLLLHRDFAAA